MAESIQLIVNREEVSVPREGEDLNVRRLLTLRDVESPDMVSVQLNGRILRREEFEDTRISEGDVVNFLYFMGGGAR